MTNDKKPIGLKPIGLKPSAGVKPNSGTSAKSNVSGSGGARLAANPKTNQVAGSRLASPSQGVKSPKPASVGASGNAGIKQAGQAGDSRHAAAVARSAVRPQAHVSTTGVAKQSNPTSDNAEESSPSNARRAPHGVGGATGTDVQNQSKTASVPSGGAGAGIRPRVPAATAKQPAVKPTAKPTAKPAIKPTNLAKKPEIKKPEAKKPEPANALDLPFGDVPDRPFPSLIDQARFRHDTQPDQLDTDSLENLRKHLMMLEVKINERTVAAKAAHGKPLTQAELDALDGQIIQIGTMLRTEPGLGELMQPYDSGLLVKAYRLARSNAARAAEIKKTKKAKKSSSGRKPSAKQKQAESTWDSLDI